MDEKMSAMEKKMELLQFIWDKVNVNSASTIRHNEIYKGTVLFIICSKKKKNLFAPRKHR